ncbi:MAG: ABC transporter permease, partial [Lachnospiraceae bacterium]|nr:ABC transporter permease [Lachnospiraceae bacterium]
GFSSLANIMTIARQVSVFGIIAVGMTFVIMTGGIDISVGSTVALGGVVAAMSDLAGNPLIVSILLAVLVGLLAGTVNGVLISYGKMLPFVATLGMLNVIRATSLIITNGSASYGMSDPFLKLSSGYLWKIPYPVIIMLVIFLIGGIVIKHMRLGRFFLAVGGNAESARLAGVNVKRVVMSAYMIQGALAALAGVLLAARLGTAQPSTGTGYEQTVIASVVIGGTSLLGGVGSMIGTLWGTLILGLVSSALNQLGVQQFYQTLVTGLIVIVAVLVDMLKKDTN